MKTRDQRPETRDPNPAGLRSQTFIRCRSLVSRPWFLVVAAAVLLALRKPWALHTPQLWAEDGEIFLNQDDQFGLRAFVTPYNGYLHFLPRLIAWLASHTVDVTWWPALYNSFAFAATVAVFARLGSPRVELPAKPWLMLALVLVAGSGEVLINVTNLQWHVAFSSCSSSSPPEPPPSRNASATSRSSPPSASTARSPSCFSHSSPGARGVTDVARASRP